MTEKMLATDVWLSRPEVGQSVVESWGATMLGTAHTECFPAGTKASDLPDWVTKGKVINASGEETESPLLGPHVWADEPEAPPPAPPGPPGITLTGGMFDADGAFTPFATEELFVEADA